MFGLYGCVGEHMWYWTIFEWQRAINAVWTKLNKYLFLYVHTWAHTVVVDPYYQSVDSGYHIQPEYSYKRYGLQGNHTDLL